MTYPARSGVPTKRTSAGPPASFTDPYDTNNETQEDTVLDVNEFDQLRIGLATADGIRMWSNGEVKKPETINYRTLKPEKDGLFCEKIFGPQKDWECYCGKYKRVRFKGIICERCGVEVTRSKVRRDRMGHIELAAPAVHIWYLRGTRSWLAYLLMGTEPREELKAKQLEKVIYFAANMVVWVDEEKRHEDLPGLEAELAEERLAIEEERDRELNRRQEDLEGELVEMEAEGAKESELKARAKAAEKDLQFIREQYEQELDVLNRAWDEFTGLFARQIVEEDMLWRELEDRWGDYFKGGMGADALAQLIDRINFDDEEVKLRSMIDPPEGQKPLSVQRKQKAIKRLKIVAAFNRRDQHGRRVNEPRAMILDAVPVIPPELRPMVQLDGGRFATSDLNDLYRRVINRNNRLKRLLDLGAPTIIVNNEKRMLQEGRRRLVRTTAVVVVRSPAQVTGRSSRCPTCLRASKAGFVRTCSARGSTSRAGRSSWPAPHLSSTSAACPRSWRSKLFKTVRHEEVGRRGVCPEHQIGQAHGRAAQTPRVDSSGGRDSRAPGTAEPRPHTPPAGHSGLRAGAGRGQGHPDPPAGVHRLQRRL